MIHYRDEHVTVYHGDCLNILPELSDNSVDAVVTDPPYGLDFMGKHWDTGAVAFDPTVWKHCLRVLKPGGHLLAFGGTRTWHRLACAIEDAGFEIRDSIAWLYGSGFPKSLDVSKAIDKAAGAERELTRPGVVQRGGLGEDWDTRSSSSRPRYDRAATKMAEQWQGWGTALKPAHEPIIVARKPLSGTVAANVLEHGTGALNIDACRVAATDGYEKQWDRPVTTNISSQSQAYGTGTGTTHKVDISANKPAGRWPPNVVLDDHQAAELDQQSGHSKSPPSGNIIRPKGRQSDSMAGPMAGDRDLMNGYGDSGGASRYFPTFKYEPKAPSTERPTAEGVSHPTVKPLDLMRWLIRLVTPPHGLVLDPFAGSGTTAEACIHEHMRCTTIEQESDYLPVIVNRLHKPMQVGFDFYNIGEFDT